MPLFLYALAYKEYLVHNTRGGRPAEAAPLSSIHIELSGPLGPLFLILGGQMGLLDKVKELLEPTLEKEGYELADVSLSRNKEGLTLHLVVDRDAPISLDDIVKVSDIINPLLDKEDPINEAYMLDVSSAGSEKPLRLERLAKYVGEFVNVHLVNPYEGYNFLEGDLKEVTEEEIKLEIRVKGRKKTLSLARSNIDKARLAIKF